MVNDKEKCNEKEYNYNSCNNNNDNNDNNSIDNINNKINIKNVKDKINDIENKYNNLEVNEKENDNKDIKTLLWVNETNNDSLQNRVKIEKIKFNIKEDTMDEDKQKYNMGDDIVKQDKENYSKEDGIIDEDVMEEDTDNIDKEKLKCGEKEVIRNEDAMDEDEEKDNMEEYVIKEDKEKNSLGKDNMEEDTLEEKEKDNMEEDVIDTNSETCGKGFIYFIISCPLYSSLDLIKIIPKKNTKIIMTKIELIKIKVKKEILFKFNIYEKIDFKNIYLYKAEINILKENPENSFKIKITYNNQDIISKDLYTIKNNQHLFIYSQNFEYKRLFNWLYKTDVDSLNKKYSISYIQRFLIYKSYLLQCHQLKEGIMDNLLNETLKIICLLKNIDLEFILVYFVTVYEITENYIDILKNFDPSSPIFIDLQEKNEIIVKKNKINEYSQFIFKFQESVAKNINVIHNGFSDKTDGNDNKTFYYYYHLFLLTFYNSKNPENFNEIFETSISSDNDKKDIISYIKNHPKIFSNFDYSSLFLFIKHLSPTNIFSLDDIEWIKKQFSVLIGRLKNKNYYELKNLKKCYLEFEKSLITDNNDENKNNNNKNDNDKNDNDKNDNDNDSTGDNDSDSIHVNNDDSISKKYLLKEILNDINEAIHSTGTYFINEDKFYNMEIIQFIQDDSKFYSKKYEKEDGLAKLISHISFDKIDEDFCHAFLYNKDENDYFDYAGLYKSKYILFVESLSKKITNYRHLQILYKLLRIKDHPQENYHLVILIHIFSIKDLKRDDLTIENLSKDIIGPLFKLVSDNDNKYLSRLIPSVKKKFTEKEFNALSMLIISNLGNQLNEELIQKMFENVNELSNNDILRYLKFFEDNNEIKKLLLKRLADKRIKGFDEIMNKDISENTHLLHKLIEMNLFEEDENNSFIDLEYVSNTRNTMDEIFHNLMELNISMEQLQKMHRLNQYNELKERCFIISLGKKDRCNDLYELIDREINHCIKILKKIEEIISIFSIFYPSDKKNMIIFYKNLKSFIMEHPIYEFPKNDDLKYFPPIHESHSSNNNDNNNNNNVEMINNMVNFNELYREAHGITELMNSKIFIKIYEIIKSKPNVNLNIINNHNNNNINNYSNNENINNNNSNRNNNNNNNVIFIYDEDTNNINIDDTSILNKAKLSFFYLNNIFNPNTENIINLCFLENIFSEIKIEELNKEIDILKEIFKIPKDLSNDINEKLKLLIERRNTIKLIKNVILLLKDFVNINITNRNPNNENNDFTTNNEIENKLIKQVQQLEKCDFLEQLLQVNKNLKNLKLKILNNNNTYLNSQDIVNKMYEKPELISFIKNKEIDIIHQLGEFIDDSEDFFLSISDIIQLENCMTFINELKNINKKVKSEETFLNLFVAMANKKRYKDIGLKFENSAKKYNDFYELYTINLNPNDLNKEHIKKIYNSSTFILKSSYPEYHCTVYYNNNNKSMIKDFEELLDLRDVALLRKKDQQEDQYFNVCEGFVDIIGKIQDILKILNTIASKGYFEEINYVIEVNKGNVYGYQKNNNDNNEHKNLNDIILELECLRNIQNRNIKSFYSSSSIIQLLYGRQFSYLYQFINSNLINNSFNYKVIKNIIKYVTNNKNSMVYTYNGNKNKRVKITYEYLLNQMFNDLLCYLEELYNNNKTNLKEIYKKAFLKDSHKKGIYIHSCQEEEIESNIIYCSLSLTGNLPIAHTVLYCNNDTSEEEIISFIYKSVKCKYNTLFILIKPENLDINNRNLLIELLKELYSSNPEKMKSLLLFIYGKKSKCKDIITEIEKLPNSIYYDYNPKTKKSNIKKYFKNVEIYSSEFSGLGKSREIKRKFEDEDREYRYVYFPLSGDINKKDIIERLLNLENCNDPKINSNKIALHLDLYDTNKIELIREFLFSILILKYYSQNENIFYFGNEIKIKVEIPNSFIDMMVLFPFLRFFNNIHINSDNLPRIIISERLTSPIQIVCNYLKNLNYINENDIYIENVSYGETPNCIWAVPMSQEECCQYILEYLNIENPNYYQIESYINIIAGQLKLFTQSFYLNVELLNEISQARGYMNHIRMFFIDSLLKITKYFVTSSYDNILKGQNITHDQQVGNIDFEKANEQAVEILANKQPFSIKNIKPSMILINEDGQSISEIVTCERNSNEYKLLKDIYNTGSLHGEQDILNYKELTPEQFLIEVSKVLNLHNPILNSEMTNSSLPSLESIVKSYVFTEDNFIKLILICLRVRTEPDIPVILMGETGCGKTSLVRIIAKLKNITLLTLNIHAGIEDKDIINFLKKEKLFEDNVIYDENMEDMNLVFNEVWVFLDEINTCHSLGLITEIMLKHSCNGRHIRPNIKFIAACNPYRLNTTEPEIIGLYDEEKYNSRKLVYNVNPLPHSLLNFVFDFGTPGSEDIKRYISSIISNIFKELNLKTEIIKSIKSITENSIYVAQEYLRNNYDISTVSLREIRRWSILFKWFIQLLKKSYFEKRFKFKTETNKEFIYIYSLNLAMYLCYYKRIFNKKKRKGFIDLMKKTFGSNFDFEEFPKIIQNLIADEIQLDKGIARNKALLENIFAIFVCLNTNIPLFIVGKPGCSKSLSAQLVFKSMNGKDSTNNFFKLFPKVYTKSYQGSLTSNSKGVLKIFKKARDSLKDNKQKSNKIISAIYFDEMGLAEVSKNNPLKVIHSQLEYDENKTKISFIGISNWPLDASKMNRGIHISIPEPDEEDLQETAQEIAKSYDQRLLFDYKNYFINLALSYYQYKEKLKSLQDPTIANNYYRNNKNIKEFHGTRDFYYLIKTVSQLLIESNFVKDEYSIINIINESIERNFGGLNESVIIFKKKLKKYIPGIEVENSNYNVMKCIEDNIKDNKSRYLLIETKSSLSHFLITLILNRINKNHVFYYGSNFDEDISHGYYSAKILNKIQVTMSQNTVMILKNLSSMYPSLYDLFNQNFRVVGGSKYARIALGNSNTQNYFVNDDFRCIVLLDKSEIEKQDPPFINRFEKHIISFEYLLNKNEIKISKDLQKLISDIANENNKKLKICLKNELINCDLDEIQGMIYQLSDHNNNSKNEENNINYEDPMDIDTNELFNNIINLDTNKILKNKVFEKIVPTFSQDIIFYAKNSSFYEKYNEEFKTMLDIYLKEEEQHKSLRSYLENINSNKHIIYTFSNILDSIFGYDNGTNQIMNSKYGQFNNEQTKNIFVNEYHTERDIDKIILDYYTNNNFNLCIFHFNIDDIPHLVHINYLINNNEINLKENNAFISKVILFIIHCKRKIVNSNKNENLKNEYLLSHLTEWKQFFIDNLNDINISFDEIFRSSTNELFRNENLINLEEEFRKDLYHAFTLISYNLKINFSPIEKDEYIENICEYIFSNDKLKTTIQNLIIKKIDNFKDNIIMKVFTEYNFEENDVDFISVIIKYMKSVYNNALISTIIQFEKQHILSTKMLNERNNINHPMFDKVYYDCISQFNNIIQQYSVLYHREKINILLGITYPCIIPEFSKINNYINTLINDYVETNDQYKKDQITMEEYIIKINNLENNLKIEFENYYFAILFQNDDDNMIEDADENNSNEIHNELLDFNDTYKFKQYFFNDYIIFYLSKSKSNDKFSNSNIINFFTVLYKLLTESPNYKNNDQSLNLETIAKFILFIESYKECIYILCEFICSISKHFKTFLDYYINYITKIFNNDYDMILGSNAMFFKLYESVIYCFFSIKIKFNNLSDNNFNEFIMDLSNFYQNLEKVNIELGLKLKQLLYLFDFIQVKNALIKQRIPLKDNLHQYVPILLEEINHFSPPFSTKTSNIDNQPVNNKEMKNENPINTKYKFLRKILHNDSSYGDLIVKLINNELKISKNKDYIKILLEILCSNSLFINKSKIIFKSLFKKLDLFPSSELDMNIISIKNEKYKLITEFLNQNNNPCLDEILISIFDEKIMKNNELIRLNNEEMVTTHLKVFKDSIEYIDDREHCNITNNNRLIFLYCISYTKYYSYQFCKLLSSNSNKDDIKLLIYNINNVLIDSTPFKKIIKLYILKVLHISFIKNYKKFLHFIQKYELFINDFNFTEKSPNILNYLFIQNNTIEIYKILRQIYINSKRENYKIYSDRIILELTQQSNSLNRNILIFYDLLINEEMSNALKSNKENSEKLDSFIKNIFSKIELPQLSQNLISLGFDFKSLINSQIKKSKEYDIYKIYEILLYANKFAFICSLSENKNSLYSKIVSKNIMRYLNELYIPGGEPNDCLMIESADYIKEYKNNGGGEAVYMCSCYSWYRVGGCGLPMETFKCKNCNKLIGGNNHIMVKREGHFRICFNNDQYRYTNDYRSSSCMMYDEFMKLVEEKRNIQYRGHKQVERSFFINKNKKVRNMNNITYRILSFIFYSCIFYDKKSKFISKNDIKTFYYSDANEHNKSILHILIEIWRILTEELSAKNIKNIQCFLNMVIPELSEIIIKNKNSMENEEERSDFENKCNQIIIEKIENYQSYYPMYIKNNQEILEIKDDTFKSILQETSNIYNLPQEQYPLIHYYYVANYPSYENFYEQFTNIQNRKDQFPVITYYLKGNENKEPYDILKNFKLINPLITYVIEKYNNKISREDAKIIIIKNELKSDKTMKNLFTQFQKGWKNIYLTLSNYDCHGQLPPKNITEDDCLAFILNDTIEDNYGKYIATAYKDFITYQNEFLKPLIEDASNKPYLYPYINHIKKAIIIQNASEDEIISLDIQNKTFDSVDDLIISYSNRDCFGEDGQIIHMKYKDHKYDYKSIEEELSRILLSEKRLFLNEQYQKFITFAYEGFNQNESIILDFKGKIKNTQLLSELDKINMSYFIENTDYNLILFNLQSLFLYFINKRNIKGNEILINELDQMPTKIINLDQNFIDFIKNFPEIRLNQMIDCYEYIESLNFYEIVNKIPKNTQIPMTSDQILNFDHHFNNNNILLITKNELSEVIRKFISRFLVSERFRHFEWNLMDILELKEELWTKNVICKENEARFNEEIDKLKLFNIKINQSLSFYNRLKNVDNNNTEIIGNSEIIDNTEVIDNTEITESTEIIDNYEIIDNTEIINSSEITNNTEIISIDDDEIMKENDKVNFNDDDDNDNVIIIEDYNDATNSSNKRKRKNDHY